MGIGTQHKKNAKNGFYHKKSKSKFFSKLTDKSGPNTKKVKKNTITLILSISLRRGSPKTPMMCFF